MIDSLEGKNFHELVQGGLSKMASMGTGSAPAASGSSAAAAPVKEEKKEEAEEVDMGNLFGGDDDYWELGFLHLALVRNHKMSCKLILINVFQLLPLLSCNSVFWVKIILIESLEKHL